MQEHPTDKILIVDDDPAVTEHLGVKLAGRYRIVATNEPADALALARSERPDLILCDVEMPGMDGYELCRRLKQDASLGDTPVIFLTGTRTSEADERRGLASGAVDYLDKTVDRGVLEARLKLHLSLRRAQRAMEDQNAMLEARVAERTAELLASREALREAMHNLRTTRVSGGVYWVQVPEAGLYILCGSPADVVKHLMLRGYVAEESKAGVESETGPNVILLSDVLLQNGSFANLSEFPILQMLYRQGLILPGHPNNTGAKPLLVGSQAQVSAQLSYIYRGNYGLSSEEELRAAGLDEEEARRQMALKLGFAFGRIRPTEDLLDYRVIGDGPVEIARGVTVQRLALNRFELAYQGRTTEVNLNLQPGKDYESPYSPGQYPVAPQQFGVIHCGEGDGWDMRRQSMASIVMFQGRYYLVDAGPSVQHTLRSLGIDLSEIAGVFHTHAHDDHFAGLPTLLASGQRIKYFSTRLVRESVAKKLSALMSIEESMFGRLFEIHDLEPDQWNSCEGMEVLPFISPHPVENCVFLFRVRDGEGYKSYAHWADIASMSVLRRLVAEPPADTVLPPGYADAVLARYLTPASLKKIDAGGGLVHGDALDFAADNSDKIVLAHRAASFSRTELEVGSQATFGAVDVLIPSSQDFLQQAAYAHLVRMFPGVARSRLSSLVRARATQWNAGSLIVRRGEKRSEVLLVVTGSVVHDREDLGAPLTLPTGSLIGLEALFDDPPPVGTWRAASHVTLLPIECWALAGFLSSTGWHERLRSMLSEASFLRRTWLFGERLALDTQARIGGASGTVQLPARHRLETTAEACLYLLREGAIELDGRGAVLETIAPGGFVGEERCIGRPAPPWSAIAQTDSVLLALPCAAIADIPIALWKMLEVHERRLALAQMHAAV